MKYLRFMSGLRYDSKFGWRPKLMGDCSAMLVIILYT